MEEIMGDEFWEGFQVEAEEGFKQIEILLLQTESQDQDSIGALFRVFHSLKGASRMLGLMSMGAVAHAAEDLLGLVREGKLDLIPLTDLLLETMDALRELCQEGVEKKQDTAPREQLIQRLKEIYEAVLVGKEIPSVREKTPPNKGQEDEALLLQFSEMIQEELPVLNFLLDEKKLSISENYEKLLQSFDVLERTARIMEFERLSQILSDLSPFLPKEEGDYKQKNQEKIQILLQKVKSLSFTPSQEQEKKNVTLPKPTQSTISSKPKETAKSSTTTKSTEMLRVNGETLDHFMNQIGEMVLVRSMLFHAAHDEKSREALSFLKGMSKKWKHLNQELGDDLEIMAQHVEVLKNQQQQIVQTDLQLNGVLQHLQEGVMELRVVPIDTIFNRFPRIIRDIAHTQHKNVHLEMEGRQVRIDKGMVELLLDPIMHMIRNSVDHGIELPEEREEKNKPVQATVRLEASQKGNRVSVSISDDGKGIDPEKILSKAVEKGLVSQEEGKQLSQKEIYSFIFAPGFSMAKEVTDISGRGVGMDVVRTNINRLGGSIEIQSELGKGSTFILELPLSAAIQETLMVEVNQQMVAIPDRYVSEVLETSLEKIQSVRGRKALLLRGSFLPIFYLHDLLGHKKGAREKKEEIVLVVLSNGTYRIGIEVDRLFHRQELFVKDIHPQLAALPGVGGASILGDGRVILILDGEELITLAEKLEQDKEEEV